MQHSCSSVFERFCSIFSCLIMSLTQLDFNMTSDHQFCCYPSVPWGILALNLAPCSWPLIIPNLFLYLPSKTIVFLVSVTSEFLVLSTYSHLCIVLWVKQSPVNRWPQFPGSLFFKDASMLRYKSLRSFNKRKSGKIILSVSTTYRRLQSLTRNQNQMRSCHLSCTFLSL